MEDVMTAVVLGSYALLLLLDHLVPARQLAEVRRWRIKGLFFFGMLLALNVVLPPMWSSGLAHLRLIDATSLGTAGGAVVGLLALQLLSYVWHRAMHRVPFLWRWFHQMHHSAERIDIYGASYFHPLDVVGFAFVSSLALVTVVGVNDEAAILAGSITSLLSFLGHANLRTPRWLGYLIQRPENHALHHARGVHAHNYGDIALWDMIFGTWRNPAAFPEKAGFHDGASARVGEMLIGRDVSEPPRRAAPEGARVPA